MRWFVRFAVVALVLLVSVLVLAGNAIANDGDGSTWTKIWPTLWPIIQYVVPLLLGGRYVLSAHNKYRTEKIASLADDALAWVLYENPHLTILANLKKVLELVADSLLENPSATNSKAVAKRAASGAIQRAWPGLFQRAVNQ